MSMCEIAIHKHFLNWNWIKLSGQLLSNWNIFDVVRKMGTVQNDSNCGAPFLLRSAAIRECRNGIVYCGALLLQSAALEKECCNRIHIATLRRNMKGAMHKNCIFFMYWAFHMRVAMRRTQLAAFTGTIVKNKAQFESFSTIPENVIFLRWWWSIRQICWTILN